MAKFIFRAFLPLPPSRHRCFDQIDWTGSERLPQAVASVPLLLSGRDRTFRGLPLKGVSGLTLLPLLPEGLGSGLAPARAVTCGLGEHRPEGDVGGLRERRVLPRDSHSRGGCSSAQTRPGPHGQTLEKPWGTHTPRKPPCTARGCQPDQGPDPALGVLPVGSAWVGLAREAPRHPDGQAVWPLGSSHRAAAGSIEAAQGPGTRPEPAPSDPRACLLSAPSRPCRRAEAATGSTLLPGGRTRQGGETQHLRESCSAWLPVPWETDVRLPAAGWTVGSGAQPARPGHPWLSSPRAAPVGPEASCRALSTELGGGQGGDSPQAARRQGASPSSQAQLAWRGAVSTRAPWLTPEPLG